MQISFSSKTKINFIASRKPQISFSKTRENGKNQPIQFIKNQNLGTMRNKILLLSATLTLTFATLSAQRTATYFQKVFKKDTAAIGFQSVQVTPKGDYVMLGNYETRTGATSNNGDFSSCVRTRSATSNGKITTVATASKAHSLSAQRPMAASFSAVAWRVPTFRRRKWKSLKLTQ